MICFFLSFLQEAHHRVCRLMETLPASIIVEVRDLIDRTSEGRGFLPLVLTGGMEHYRLLASVRFSFILCHRMLAILKTENRNSLLN